MQRGSYHRLRRAVEIYLLASNREEKQMTIDERIARVKDLIQKWEEIDAGLAGMFDLTVLGKTALRCSKCGAEGHNAKTCNAPEPQEPQVISE
jgi:hypothetical protein